MSKHLTAALCLAAVVACVATASWAQTPYYVTDLGGLDWNYGGTPNLNFEAQTLLPNGTVMGASFDGHFPAVPPPIPGGFLATWTPSVSNGITGSATYIDPTGSGSPPPGAGGDTSLFRAFGNATGQLFGIQRNNGAYTYNVATSTYTPVSGLNSNLVSVWGMGPNGLLVGQDQTNTAFAYDINTSMKYTFGTSGSSAAYGANANGYVVGYDGSSAFVWSNSAGLATLPGLAWANGISTNNSYIAGESTSGSAAVYNASSGTTATFWAGEACFVNNNGVVVGDSDATGTCGGRAMVFVDGHQYDLNTWAPTGVTFNYSAGLNDAGQIIVWGGGYWGPGPFKSYLLTPALAGDSNLDGKVDITDLSKVLTNYNKTGVTWADGDFDGSGQVDLTDLSKVLTNYSKSVAAGAGINAVPEAATLWLACVASLNLLALARRNGRKKDLGKSPLPDRFPVGRAERTYSQRRPVLVKGNCAMSRHLTMASCVAAIVACGAVAAWAQTPYYVTDLGGLDWNWGGSPNLNFEAMTLLPNGTVMGTSFDGHRGSGGPPPIPGGYLATWTPSVANGITGSNSYLDAMNGGAPPPGAGGDLSMFWAYGTATGQFGVQRNVGAYTFNPATSTYAPIPGLNSNMVGVYGMSRNGVLVGQDQTGAAFAYDLNTSTQYTIGGTNAWGNAANANGYVVGYGGSGTSNGFVWSNAAGSTQLTSLKTAVGISDSNTLIAGESIDGLAAVYNSATGSTTRYWAGEATFVNSSGVVVGDTATDGNLTNTFNGHAMVAVDGHQYDLNTWAPSGVTFNYAAGINDAGQILVSAGGFWYYAPFKSYLLTPAMSGDSNLDGKVDITDLSKVLTNYNKTGVTWADGDFDGSGQVDLTDLSKVLTNYSKSVGAGTVAKAVPEPSTLALACAGLLALLALARRKER